MALDATISRDPSDFGTLPVAFQAAQLERLAPLGLLPPRQQDRLYSWLLDFLAPLLETAGHDGVILDLDSRQRKVTG